MGKYDDLGHYLVARRKKYIRMSFREIEEVLGFSLPDAARKYPAWWSNTKSHSHASSWWDFGFMTEQVDVPGQKVTFRKTQSAPTHEHATGGVDDPKDAEQGASELAARLDEMDSKLRDFKSETEQRLAEMEAEKSVTELDATTPSSSILLSLLLGGLLFWAVS